MAERSGGVKRFTQLTDCPQSYTGLGNRIVSVKGSETGLETIPQSAGPVSTFLALTDTPGSYAGAGGQFVLVNAATNGLVFGYFGIRTTAIDISALQTDYTILVNASVGERIIRISPSAHVNGKILNIKKTDITANIVRVRSQLLFNIEGEAEYILTVPNESITIQYENTTSSWYII